MTLSVRAFTLAALLSTAAIPAFAETPDDQLVVGFSMTNVLTLDPAAITGREPVQILANVYDGLVSLDADGPREGEPGPRRELGDRARRQEHHLPPARGRDLRLGQPGDGRGRGLVAEPADDAEPGAGLVPEDPRLHRRERRGELHRAGREDRRRHAAEAGRSAGDRADARHRRAGIGARQQARHGEREGRRPRRRLAQHQLGRLGHVRLRGLEGQRPGDPDPQRRVLGRAERDEAHHHAPHPGVAEPAADAGEGRHRHRLLAGRAGPQGAVRGGGRRGDLAAGLAASTTSRSA